MKLALLVGTLLVTSIFGSNNLIASDRVVFTPKYPIACKSPQNANVLVAVIVDASISTVGQNSTIEILWNKGKCKEILAGKGGTAAFNNSINVYGRTSQGIVEIDGLNAVTKKIANGKYAQTKITFDRSLLNVTDELELYVFTGLMGPARFSVKLIENESGKFSLNINSL